MTYGLEVISLPVALTFALAVADTFSPYVIWALQAPLFAAAYAILALDVVRRTENRGLAKAVGVSISFFVSLSFMFSVATDPCALTAILCLTAGTLLLLAGAALRNPTALVAGVITLVASMVFGFDSLWTLIVRSSWIDLAVFGACAIAMGSLLDRYGVAIKLRLDSWLGAIGERRLEIALDD